MSDNSDPFSFFNFEPSLLGRSNSEKRDIQYVYGGPAKIEVKFTVTTCRGEASLVPAGPGKGQGILLLR